MANKADQEQRTTDAVRDYMLRQNRPYSLIDVFNNLRGEFPKAMVQRALESLSDAKVLVEKAVGKSKIYYANQQQFADATPDMAQTLADLDKRLAEKNAGVQALRAKHKSLDGQLKSLTSAVPVAELRTKRQSLSESLSQRSGRLDALRAHIGESGGTVDPAKRKVLADGKNKALGEWRKRKRIANDMLEIVMENCPKKKKELLEEIGVETDEEHKAIMPSST